MNAVCRTGSGSIPIKTGLISGLRRITPSSSVQEFTSSVHSGESSCVSSPAPTVSLHMKENRRGIRRCSSEPDVIRSVAKGLKKHGSRGFPLRIPEEESDDDVSLKRISSSTLRQKDLWGYGRDWSESAVSSEELEFSGGGIKKNGKLSGGKGDSADRRNIGAYYQEMLMRNPNDPLLLRNYGQYLHEVEEDGARAEEYYARAILASPGDGEVLALYAKLIWETHRDQDTAQSYFDQAVHASPNDCSVLGSYALFLWEAEEEE